MLIDGEEIYNLQIQVHRALAVVIIVSVLGLLGVVLMDMMMPEMSGYEAIRAIRAMDRYKSLPIVALTAKALKGDREECIQAGASDYISKPVDSDQLMSLLRVWLYR